MGRDYYYKPGSFYRICDRTGFRYRAERTRKEWDQLIVRDQSWEIRQPQDFVKGVRDDQTVPEARPRPTFEFTGPGQSTLAAAAAIDAVYVSVNAPFAFQLGDKLAITLDPDLGTVFYCTVGYSRDFNSDFGPDFGPPQPPLGFNGGFSSGFAVYSVTNLWVTPPLPGPAQAGNWIANLSAAEVTANSYGASNGG